MRWGLYDASGPASVKEGGQFTVSQASGGDTNGMYIRSPELDNSDWMGNLLARKPGVSLNELVMPGSHDAGMSSTSGGSGASEEWARTQGRDISGQLKAGSRYFDFRALW